MPHTTHRPRSLAAASASARACVSLGLPALALGLATLVAPSARAEKPVREGVQLEGLIGGSACMPGRAPCRYEDELFTGNTRPSFGMGATLGWRARRWFLLGAAYRLGMFDPSYSGDSSDYSYAAQHTVAFVMRPIIPIWRFDLGLNVAPGFGRQVFHYQGSADRDWSQGFSMMVGPTIDVFITKRFFIGGEVDFIFNTQRRVCSERGRSEVCSNDPERSVAPTHQALFGLHLGGTFG